jgi:hypothetical protein
MVHELTVGDKLHLVTGDVSLAMWDGLYVFYYNKQLVTDYNIPNLYEIVKNKQWTFDKFTEISKIVSTDLNGDGVYDTEDLFGFVTVAGPVVSAFACNFDIKITQKDENNIPRIQIDLDKYSAAAEKLYGLYYDSTSTLLVGGGPETVFAQGQALFFPQSLSFSIILRGMDTDFGILPFPLFDDNQKKYNALPRNTLSMVGIPLTVSSTDDSGLIMEAIAAENYRTVVPAYYDVALKTKFARDNESSEMLDIIRDGLWINFGFAYNNVSGYPGNIMYELMVEDKSADFMSRYERSIAEREATFNKFVDDIYNAG